VKKSKEEIREGKRIHARNIHDMEQLLAGLQDGSPTAHMLARSIIYNMLLRNDIRAMEQIIRGVLMVWEEDQPQWDKM